MEDKSPKVFISYSWSSQEHRDLIRAYAERLVNDGVDVILDQWNLVEGQDKYAFMERMVTDASVTHVLVFSDQVYSKKADARASGVGTESQIISKQVYERVHQSKFIPIVCEARDDGTPYLPTLLQARIWIDFSTEENTNRNWEQLVRLLYGKPLHQKPELGTPPSYLTAELSQAALPTMGKLSDLRVALLNGRPTVHACRRDFLDAVVDHASRFQITSQLETEALEERVVGDLRSLVALRDQIIDWVSLEASIKTAIGFEKFLVAFLEALLPLKYRPVEVTRWNDAWFDALGIFVYETWLCLIAALVRHGAWDLIHSLLTTHYLLPETAGGDRDFATFDVFDIYSAVLEARNQRMNPKRISLIADVVKDSATRTDLPFNDVMQAELLVFLVSILRDGPYWYPKTLVYASHRRGAFGLFTRGARNKDFLSIRTVTGVSSAAEMRSKFRDGLVEKGAGRWHLSVYSDVSFWELANMDRLDTIA